MYEKEAKRIIEAGFVLPAYDYVLKCSHTFNLLDARGAISVVNVLVLLVEYVIWQDCAQSYLEQREKLGFPMLKEGK